MTCPHGRRYPIDCATCHPEAHTAGCNCPREPEGEDDDVARPRP